jgi:hypothetical protein
MSGWSPAADQKRLAGVWRGAKGHSLDGTVTLTPSIVGVLVGPAGPAEALIAYVRSSDQQVTFTLQNGGVWMTPAAAVQNALERPSRARCSNHARAVRNHARDVRDRVRASFSRLPGS